MKNLRLEVILREVKDYFTLLYQNRLQKIVLYGSQAREDGHEDSDIDLLVILSGVVDPYQEIDRTSEFIARLCLDYNVVVSRHFISAARFQSGDNPFLDNIRREGVALLDLHPIKTESEYEAALQEIESLLEVPPGTPEAERLDLLATLVDAYEEEHFPIALPDPIEALRFYLESRGLVNRKDV